MESLEAKKEENTEQDTQLIDRKRKMAEAEELEEKKRKLEAEAHEIHEQLNTKYKNM